MPGTAHGWEAASLLNQDAAARDIPLIILTAPAFEEHREPTAEAGADGFLARLT